MAVSNIDELRAYLAEDLIRVSQGDITPAVANASANLSGKILQSVKLELEYNAMVGSTPNISFLGKLNRKMDKLAHDPKTGEITKTS